MNKLFTFILLSFATLFVASCNQDDDSPTEGSSRLVLTFDPRYQGGELSMGERITNPHGYSVEFSEMKFYLSNLRLIHSDGSETFLSEVEFIDFRNNKRSLDFDISSGTYQGLAFDLGVPVELNGTENIDFNNAIYDVNHPLSESNGMYWGWETGYRFFVVDGRFDTLVSAEATLPEVFSLHSGRDTLYREIPAFAMDLNATVGGSNVLQFQIDVERIFITENDTVDLKFDKSFHGGFSQLGLGIRYANNTASAFDLME